MLPADVITRNFTDLRKRHLFNFYFSVHNNSNNKLQRGHPLLPSARPNPQKQGRKSPTLNSPAETSTRLVARTRQNRWCRKECVHPRQRPEEVGRTLSEARPEGKIRRGVLIYSARVEEALRGRRTLRGKRTLRGRRTLQGTENRQRLEKRTVLQNDLLCSRCLYFFMKQFTKGLL